MSNGNTNVHNSLKAQNIIFKNFDVAYLRFNFSAKYCNKMDSELKEIKNQMRIFFSFAMEKNIRNEISVQ